VGAGKRGRGDEPMGLGRPTIGSALALVMVVAVALGGRARAGQRGADRAAEPFPAEQVRFFAEQVRPILEARCLKWQGGGEKARGGSRLDSRVAILKGGDLGPAVDLDQPEQSLLLQAIRYEELEMPPGGKLPAEEVEILTRWVRQGLPWNPQPAEATV